MATVTKGPNVLTKTRSYTKEHEGTHASSIPLPEDLEALVHERHRRRIAVHRELGPGFIELVYARAPVWSWEPPRFRLRPKKTVPVYMHGGPL